MSYIKSEELIKFIDQKEARLGLTIANICNFKDIVNMFANNHNHDVCASCGAIIPEGRQVCSNCEMQNEKAN